MSPRLCRPIPQLTDYQMARFSSLTDKRGPDECWNWQGHTARGYGKIKLGRKYFLAHRISLTLAIGRGLGPEECALHRCDNPSCVNPNHLFVGTNADNIRDMVAKGRSSKNAGSKNHASKLTETQVIEIRRLKGTAPAYKIGERFGVNDSTICQILNGKAWLHAKG